MSDKGERANAEARRWAYKRRCRAPQCLGLKIKLEIDLLTRVVSERQHDAVVECGERGLRKAHDIHSLTSEQPVGSAEPKPNSREKESAKL